MVPTPTSEDYLSRLLPPDISIHAGELEEFVQHPEAGAIVSFSGIVRPSENGCAIAGLDYETHDALALPELEQVVADTAARFDILRVACAHRTGFVPAGEKAVLVHVSARHRAPALEACEYLIADLKKRVPIWKNTISPAVCGELEEACNADN
jgi:molybdopterin synthase catalytic subunit